MTNLEKIKRNFNKAVHYDKHAYLQLKTGQKLIQYIESFPITSCVDLGCGTGKTTLLLCEKLVNANSHPPIIHAIDLSEILLAKATQILPNSVTTQIWDFNQPLSSHYDLAFANMALQWSFDLSKTLQTIYSYLNQTGMLIFSLPIKNSLHELKNHFGINYFYTMNDIVTFLQEANFEVLIADSEIVKLAFTDTISALRSIKFVGANSTFYSKKSLSGKSCLMQLDIQTLTYVIGYFVAKKI